MIKRLIIAVILLGVIGGGIVGFNLFRSKMIADFFANMPVAPVTVSVTEAQSQRWQPGLDAIGTARAAQGVDLAVEAVGIVREVAFAANDRVEKGQVLLQIDDRTERADLAAAQAALELAETALTRVRELRERGVSATTTLDQAEAEAVSARATVAKLNAVLETKRLTAPFSGVIGIPQVEPGQFVTPGTVYATLQDRDRMRVDFTLTEQQVGLVSAGQPVTVVSEVGDLVLTGKVAGIEPKIDPNSRLVTIRADVENAEDRLTPGQFLRVTVALPAEDGVIALPQTVVSSTLYGDSVYVVRAGDTADAPEKVEQVFVHLGRRSGALVEIVEGVQPGDRVVNAGQNKLSPGAAVVIDNTVSPDTANGN
ncbi:efflux RND transporter periplasmic adaptor subunit [Phaeovulum sp. NW3]|uniref:efflux RND transporter periplasmic adaptor subunit n=1 Tax=Phaeovulum sp. NW3 TaxID=2934933 RepID=UPI00201FCBBD|nr:efflux RND transporter periplasmic adaptor subunit [Phaeovulum sp. NW3]MCL7463661.1 efflux RND transporter periplasmic adaptor subunit [Phaeovulum sp. NW3]